MKKTRRHVCETELDASPETVFQLLITPSAIREWWQASRAIVDAREGGVWGAAWGSSEDDPDYTGFYRIPPPAPPPPQAPPPDAQHAQNAPHPPGIQR